ncbi:GNAT family N-acetyltransferase [Saccharicrinis aurantiacus]|uniref:GNAT family N-acetyltransferase n=1 Tax=Saccharicrinis aurantiacus TaxID=1849719 RepID=UPI00094F644A|nr:GNAT family N-acetyltransferase [Saccharicrinis aurantiacus]
MNIQLNELNESDLEIVKEIYDYYIINSTATFHTEHISINELKEFMYVGDAKYKSYLVEFEGEVCGYCYLAPYKKRQAYAKTAEVTLYLKPNFGGKGIGKQVLLMIEKIALQNGINNLLGIITGENLNSIKLFERCGYNKCGHFVKVGEKFNRLLDVLAYQKILG